MRTESPAIRGIAARTPLVHWIHSVENRIVWETLPIDGGPAIHRSVSSFASPRGSLGHIGWLRAPVAPQEVPFWMDDYINKNPAINCGENPRPAPGRRRFGWSKEEVTRDTFDVLRASDSSPSDVKPEVSELARGAVRSPANLFSVAVAQLDEKGMYSEDGDDGVNVYLEDRRVNKSHLLYFAGLYSAWPSAATWFTDRYVIITGTSNTLVDLPDDSDPAPRFHPQCIRVFDLLRGRSFETRGIAGPGPSNAPTERIFFPDGSYADEVKWRTLWQAVESGCQLKPEAAPVLPEVAAAVAKLPDAAGLQWKDLGIWPPPETWRLSAENESSRNPDEKVVRTDEAFLSCMSTADGQRHYSIAISGGHYQDHFEDRTAAMDVVARADFLTAGGGSLPKVETVQRMGDNKRYLLLAGTYQKPGTLTAGTGKWMLLTDLLHHRTWSAHW